MYPIKWTRKISLYKQTKILSKNFERAFNGMADVFMIYV